MNDSLQILGARLIKSGYREMASGFFHANHRILALIRAGGDPATWSASVNQLIGSDFMRNAPAWGRYVILLVDDYKTPALVFAAAAFAKDVEACRRLVVLTNGVDLNSLTLPFLPLPMIKGVSGPHSHNVEALVHECFESGQAREAFLDDTLPKTRVEAIIEESVR
jgi:hypothetical protein